MRKEQEKGLWLWPESQHHGMASFDLSKADIAFIRSLVVAWSIAERGAPTLVTPEGDWLEEDYFTDHPKRELLMHLFFSLAQLPQGNYEIANPYFKDSTKLPIEEGVYGFKHKATINRLKEEKQIALKVDQTLQKLWGSHDLRPSGFDSKRGFMEAYRTIIDPEKQMGRGPLIKARKEWVGQLFLYLQLFVQQATLPLGTYHTLDGFSWAKGPLKIPQPLFTKCEWLSAFGSDFYYAGMDMAKAMMAIANVVPLLAQDKAVDYAYVVKTFNLQQQYKYLKDRQPVVAIDQLTIVTQGLVHFSEHKDQMNFDLSLHAARIHNTAGRFGAALQVLQDAAIDVYTEDHVAFFNDPLPHVALQLAFFEGFIARVGQGKTQRYFINDWGAHHQNLDLRLYQNWKYRADTDKILQDLEDKDARDIAEFVLPIIMQLELLNAIAGIG